MLHSEVEALALRHVPGGGAVAVERLGAGLVNDSYRVMRGGRSFSLRVPSAHAAPLGLDHDLECRVLGHAAAEGLAPQVEYCDPRTGILVLRWADGRTWAAREVRAAANLERIAHLAHRIHRLPIPQGARAMGPAAWSERYRRALAPRADSPLERLQDALAERLAEHAGLPPVAPVLCHSDLHAQNLVVGEHDLVLLDWEYAHVSEPFWDLAGWAVNNELDARGTRLLLAGYVGRWPSAAESARLRLLVWLYGYLSAAWIELYCALRAENAESPELGGGLPGRLQQLIERLRSR